MNPYVGIRDEYGFNDKRIVSPKELLNENYIIDPKNFIWVYSSGHMLFDLNNNPIPIPYLFDYIGSPFNNKKSHLKPMLEHLKNHPWVINKNDLRIIDVPYYNNDGNDRYICGTDEIPYIIILPDKESYIEMYKEASSTKRGKEYFSCDIKDIMVSNYDGKDYMNIKQFRRTTAKDIDD